MHDVMKVLAKLPEVVYTTNRVTGKLIAIRRGVVGYYPVELSREVGGGLRVSATPDELNLPWVTKAQIAAMESGSIFGWEIPAADPDNYDADGNIILAKIKAIGDGKKGWCRDGKK
ncbi:MAG: hypothetical protein ACREI9_05670 [Nitrospiraceae bacterium]